MKRIFFAIAALTLFTSQVQAQKFMTRTGKISFFSSTPVENIEAVNNEVSSVLTNRGDLVFQVPIKSFKFEKALMQEHFNENYMESGKYPKADFVGTIGDMTTISLDKNGTYKTTVKGKLTMHGVTKDVSVPGTITVKDGTITTAAKFKVKPTDYGIKIPGVVAGKIAEQIEITVNSILNKI